VTGGAQPAFAVVFTKLIAVGSLITAVAPVIHCFRIVSQVSFSHNTPMLDWDYYSQRSMVVQLLKQNSETVRFSALSLYERITPSKRLLKLENYVLV